MENLTKKCIGLAFLLCSFIVKAQTETLYVDVSKSKTAIQPTMFGVFFEDINFAADGGLYAEMVKNRSFEFLDPFTGWKQPHSDRHTHNTNSGIAIPMKYKDNPSNKVYCRVTIKKDSGYELINEGFRGMGVVKEHIYDLSLKAANVSGNISQIKIELISPQGKVLGATQIEPNSKEWKTYTSSIKAQETEAKAQLRITFEGEGEINLDMISLFPRDTWKGRKNGLRKDLVQLLYDLKPGFVRFPGGCIVEGRTLAERYQWKKTIGNVEDRELLINRWNVEFGHRLTPDYFQSFGLGFFEYFLLSEDLGAEPLPILSCGMACQFNTGELVEIEELGPYVQDALDLIEFANGGVETTWGKKRKEMGHPEPFNLKYIGIGNEQWGEDYIERYKIFEKAIKEKYPNMIIVSGSGPFPDGDYFEYGMEQLKKLNAEIVDEHYYKSAQWFRENATRYDNYDRKGPKIFAGEYAAQSVAIASPENRNNWDTALAEAAFITGLERNADVVHLTSYAPLMAHVDAWQWTPDMIWFDNLASYGTPNYYVQKMFSTNKGTDLFSITDGNKKDLVGQNNLYASAVIDKNDKELIVKIVNTEAKEKKIDINIQGGKLGKQGVAFILQNDDLKAENSLSKPLNISPKQETIKSNKNKLHITIKPYSFSVLKIKINK